MLLLTHESGVKVRKLGLLRPPYRRISGPTAERAFRSSVAARARDKSSHDQLGIRTGVVCVASRHITLIEMIL